MEKYLRSTEIIDWTQTDVFRLAGSLAAQNRDKTEIAKRCFEWVRDKVKHSYDYQCSPVPVYTTDRAFGGLPPGPSWRGRPARDLDGSPTGGG